MSSPPSTRGRLRVLLCEPYFTGSHRAWAEGLAAHSTHDVTLVTHAGGFWKWRMQGAALTLAAEIRRVTAGGRRPDVLLASGMVHLPALLGLARDVLGGVPVVLYLHENQLTYPLPDDAPRDDTYAMVNWLSAAAADRVVFNSEHHRREFVGALGPFLRRFPDHRHTGALDHLADRTAVLPVGIDAGRFAGPRDERRPPVVLWNHRWEYDKDPAAFFAALDAVRSEGVEFRLAVAGEAFHTVPREFDAARTQFADRLVHFGTAAAAAYPDLLRASDVVVSTALHEFFGVAVVEAMAAGAVPVLPHRLSYPELLPAEVHDRCLYHDRAGLVAALCELLADHDGRRATAALVRAHMSCYAWERMAPRYDRLLEAVAAAR